MRINARVLYQAVKSAPNPTREGEVYRIKVDRPLQRATTDPISDAIDIIECDIVTLVSKKYCENTSINCWYEWLVEIGE